MQMIFSKLEDMEMRSEANPAKPTLLANSSVTVASDDAGYKPIPIIPTVPSLPILPPLSSPQSSRKMSESIFVRAIARYVPSAPNELALEEGRKIQSIKMSD